MHRVHRIAALLAGLLAAIAVGAPSNVDAGRYRLFVRDLLKITVFGEEGLDVQRRIDGNGTVSLPLVGSVALEGLTLPEAEEKIRRTYVAREIFVRPQVSVAVAEYVPREVSVIGQVKNPGKVPLPIEVGSVPIVDVISLAGGFTRLGRADSVRVTRKIPDGSEQSFVIDVQRMFNGRGGARPFLIYPGDVVFVPERLL